MPSETRTMPRKVIIPSAAVFFALQVAGAIVAIIKKLPYEVGGQGDPDNVGRDFLAGSGTALSAPLIMLVILALLVLLGRRKDRWGTLALSGTVIVGSLGFAFGVQEPIARRMLETSPFGLYEAMVVVLHWGSLLAALALVLASFLVNIGRMRRNPDATA